MKAVISCDSLSQHGLHLTSGSCRHASTRAAQPTVGRLKMNMIYLFATIILSICCQLFSENEYNEFIWRPSSITYRIEIDNQYLKIGKYLYLQNKLFKNETGWTMTKIDIPDFWEVKKMYFIEKEFIIELKTNKKYKLSKNNINKLDFEILNNGIKKDKELEKVWDKYAKIQ